MKKILLVIVFLTSITAYSQNKTAQSYWGKIPHEPLPTAESFQKFIQELEDLKLEIKEEADKQSGLVQQKISAVNPQNIPKIQNADPAAIQKQMKEIQDRMTIMNDMMAKDEALKKQLSDIHDAYKADFDKKIAPLENKIKTTCPDGEVSKSDPRLIACQALEKELAIARKDLLNTYFLNGQSSYNAYLGNYAAWIKSTENDVIRMWEQTLAASGVSVKGMGCAETLKPLIDYLTVMQAIFGKPIYDRLVK